MNGHDIFHVIITSPSAVDLELTEQVASVLELEPYIIRPLLSATLPKVVAQYPTRQLADSTVQRLKALGFMAFVCLDSELHKPPVLPFTAYNLQQDTKEITFLDISRRKLSIKETDVFLILTAIKTNKTTEKATSPKMKFSLAGTVLTGGIPVWRKVKEETQQVSIHQEGLIRIYKSVSFDPIVEIVQTRFNYSFLGTKITLSSSTNLSATVIELKNQFPHAAFDDRLSKNISTGEQFEIDCRLIFLYYQHLNNLNTLS